MTSRIPAARAPRVSARASSPRPSRSAAIATAAPAWSGDSLIAGRRDRRRPERGEHRGALLLRSRTTTNGGDRQLLLGFEHGDSGGVSDRECALVGLRVTVPRPTQRARVSSGDCPSGCRRVGVQPSRDYRGEARGPGRAWATEGAFPARRSGDGSVRSLRSRPCTRRCSACPYAFPLQPAGGEPWTAMSRLRSGRGWVYQGCRGGLQESPQQVPAPMDSAPCGLLFGFRVSDKPKGRGDDENGAGRPVARRCAHAGP